MSEVEAEKIEPVQASKDVPIKKVPADIEIEKGSIVPKTASQLVRTIEQIAEGGGFPSRFKTPASRMAAYNLSQSLMGSRWQLCLNNVAAVHGQMMIFGELPGALAEQTKEVVEKHVYAIDQNHNKICVENKNLDAQPYAGVCIIQRKGREKKEFTYTIEEAKNAGQYPATKNIWENGKCIGKEVNPDSPWMKFTKVMLLRKAMNLAIKFEFADAMVGVPVAEYDADSAPDLVEEREVAPDNASALNKLF